jgi:hypothetical protein
MFFPVLSLEEALALPGGRPSNFDHDDTIYGA